MIEELSSLHLLWLILRPPAVSAVHYIHAKRLRPRLVSSARARLHRRGIPLEKLEYARFPGSYFEAQEETYLHANDRIYDRHRDNLYLRLVFSFLDVPEAEIALKKELFNRYTLRRVKTWVLLRHLSRDCPRIDFIPLDSEDAASALSSPPGELPEVSVPPPFTLLNRMRAALGNFLPLLIPFLLLALILKVAGKGVTLATPDPVAYDLGFDIQELGLKRDRGLVNGEFFLYDEGVFHPSKILHVVRSRLEDAAARESLERIGCPFVEFSRIRSPLSYLLGRGVRDLMGRASLRALSVSFTADRRSFFLYPSLAVLKLAMEWEVFYRHYPVRVFIARDEYSPAHIVRTLVARRHGCRTASFQWADLSDRGDQTSHFLFDRYALWGDFYRDFLAKSLQGSGTEVVGANIYGSDTIHRMVEAGAVPEKYREIGKGHTIVAVMGSSFSPDLFVTREMTLRFYRETVEALAAHEHVFCILKPKNDALDEELSALAEKFPRTVIERSLHTYAFLLVPDLVIASCNSSVGLEALMAGKKVLYYEVSGFSGHLYARFSPLLVAFNREELERNLDLILRKGVYLGTALLEEIRRSHGLCFDGHVTRRFRQMCLDLLATPD